MKTKALILFLTILVSGCGLSQSQRQGVQSFGQATATLGKVGQDEFVQSRQDVIAMNQYRLKLGAGEVNLEKMDGSFTLQRVQLRVAALQALQDYGELLWQLASKDLNKDFGAAAGQFVTSLRSVKGLELSEDKAGAITLIATSVGGLLLEAARAKAVQRIVEETSPVVQKLADLVKNTFDDEGTGWSAGYEQAIKTLDGDLIVARKQLADGPHPNRAIVAEASAYLAKSTLRFKESSHLIKEAAGQLATAERELKELLKHEDVTPARISAYTQSIKQLIQAIKILEK